MSRACRIGESYGREMFFASMGERPGHQRNLTAFPVDLSRLSTSLCWFWRRGMQKFVRSVRKRNVPIENGPGIESISLGHNSSDVSRFRESLIVAKDVRICAQVTRNQYNGCILSEVRWSI